MTDIDQWMRELQAKHEIIDLQGRRPGPVSWLWPGRLPAGKLVVIDGDPSSAKSTLTLDLAARVSTGRPWPDQTPCPQGSVLLLSAEDGVDDTIVPRLLAAGADMSRVKPLVRVEVTDEEGRSRMTLPSLPRDIGIILDLVRQYGIRLVVIDVLMAYLSGRVDAHRDQDVRGVLHELAQLAEVTGATIVLIRHLNKGSGGNPLYRGGGSIGIVGAARSAFLIARDPDDRERIVMVPTKSNLAAMPPALAFRLESVPEYGVARVRWETEPVDFTADRLLSGPSSDEDREEADEAVAWLKAYLEDQGGSASAKDVFKAARADGIQDRRLKRARVRAGVISERKGFQGGSIWSIKESLPEEKQTVEDLIIPIRDTKVSIRAIGDTSQSPRSGWGPGVPNEDQRQPVPNRSEPIRDTDTPSRPGTLNGVPNGPNGGSGVPNGSPGVPDEDQRPASGDRPACVYCGLPLPDSAILDGFDCHAGCQEEP